MRRVGRNSFTEIYFPGCNPSFIETSDGYVMIDSPQMPMDAVRWREQMEEKAPIRYLINTEPHGEHIAGNAYFPKVQVVGQVKLQECFEKYLNAPEETDESSRHYQAIIAEILAGSPAGTTSEVDRRRAIADAIFERRLRLVPPLSEHNRPKF